MTGRSSAKGPKKKTKSTGAKPAPAPQKLGRRERNRQDKLQRIANAARTLFREKGFQGTTINDIAEAADLGFGTIFLYAKSKEELLVMVFIDEMMEIVNKTSAKMPKKPLLDQVLFLFYDFIAYHRRNETLSRALIKEIYFLNNPKRRREVNVLMDNIFGNLSSLIKAAQADGAFRKGADPALLSRNLFAIFLQLLKMWLGGYVSYSTFIKNLPQSIELQLAPMQITPKRKSAKRGI